MARTNIIIPMSVSPTRIVFRGETGKPNKMITREVKTVANGPAMRIESASRPNFRRNAFPVRELMTANAIVNVQTWRKNTARNLAAIKRTARKMANA